MGQDLPIGADRVRHLEHAHSQGDGEHRAHDDQGQQRFRQQRNAIQQRHAASQPVQSSSLSSGGEG